MFTREWFFDLEKQLVAAGLDSDDKSFAQIKSTLQNPQKLSPEAFASAAIYVVLAGGFSQKTAKIIHHKIMSRLEIGDSRFEDLISIFNNKNKINAIVKIWGNREMYSDEYYQQTNLQSRISNLEKLPHIGKITANHLARNLGENVFKRDVWIDRLLTEHGEDLLERLSVDTGLPIGYIDVVLWKGCQNKLINLGETK